MMIYLGTGKATCGKLTIGSSDDLTYYGQKPNGVGRSDFNMPPYGRWRAYYFHWMRPGLCD